MNLRSLASGLLLFTGVAHAAEWALRSHSLGMLIPGLVYFALGVWLRRPGKPALIASALVPALGGLAGGSHLIRVAFDPILAGMVAIDALVVVCCVVCLVRGEAGAPTKG